MFTQATAIYTCKTISGYIVQCDDGKYRRLSPAMRIVGLPLRQDYIPRRIGRGAADITDTPEGRKLLATVNDLTGDLHAVRSSAGAIGLRSRWGEARGPSKTIRVDADAADMLARIPEADRRRIASDAIRDAVKILSSPRN